MMFLDEIVVQSRQDLEVRKSKLSMENVRCLALGVPPPIDMAAALRGDRVRLIAEVKKASPSRGVIRHDFDPVAIARSYAAGGAAVVSVLTEGRYFGGSLDHLKDIRQAVGSRLPLLRKDFIQEPYEVYESRVYGADGLLLIVAILTPEGLVELMELSRGLGMSCLVEVHNQAELGIALDSGAWLIGINNRDLKSFDVDINITGQLRPLIPEDRIVVSESGIKNRDDIEKMAKLAIDAVLVGEALVSAADITAKLKELL
jgi:indole-3-glycerol phosphate synthase